MPTDIVIGGPGFHHSDLPGDGTPGTNQYLAYGARILNFDPGVIGSVAFHLRTLDKVADFTIYARIRRTSDCVVLGTIGSVSTASLPAYPADPVLTTFNTTSIDVTDTDIMVTLEVQAPYTADSGSVLISRWTNPNAALYGSIAGVSDLSDPFNWLYDDTMLPLALEVHYYVPDFEYTLAVSLGLQAAIDTPEVNQLGWLVVASRDGGSIKTQDGTTWSVAAKDAGGTLPGAYLAQFENRLCVLNKKNAGFAYSEAGDIVANWTNEVAFPNLPLERTGMFEGRDASGGSVLYFLTPRGVYIMDVFSNMTFAPTEVTWERDDTSGKKGLYWKGDNYIAVGKGIYKVSGSEVALVGPDMDDGLPSDLQGTITDMIGTGFWLVIAVDGGQGKKSCILKRYLTGKHWHPVYVGSVNTPIRTLMWDSGTLYFGEGTDVKSLPFPAVTDNVTQLENHEYAATGTLTYPYFHSDFESMPKVAHKVRAVTRDCNADDKITVYYRIDEDTAWTSLGSFVTSPRPAVLPFPNTGDSVGVSFERIQLKAEFARGSTTTNSPKLESLILEYRVVPPVLWSWQFRVNAVTQGDVTGKSIIEALKTAIETGTLMSFYPDGDKGGTEYFVEVAGMPGGEKGTDFGQEGLYSVTVQEVTE